MSQDPWLPIGFELPDGARCRQVLASELDWQIIASQGEGRTLLVSEALFQHWLEMGLVEQGTFQPFKFGGSQLRSISCGPSQKLCPVSEADSPANKVEALAFALALKATRAIDKTSALQDALYVEKITRLLPTFSISCRTEDDVVLGYWLTGGANVSAKSFRRLQQTLSWLGKSHLKDVVEAAGFQVSEVMPVSWRSSAIVNNQSEYAPADNVEADSDRATVAASRTFELAGRPELAAFFNEHVVDIILHRERYKALGIEFPSAVILHGPPGCGKTYAVERLVDFLGWPSFQIDASSVASPYIHETSKKVAQVFEKAIESAPSVLIIDEMEAFLADRDMGTGHHRVEEVAEFLRRIPEAVSSGVLIIAMTNRLDMIDPAIQRRGRFDHIVAVNFASEVEVSSLLDNLLASLPKGSDVDTKPLASELAGRPLSDVAFVVREGARLAARAGRNRLDQESLLSALRSVPAREREGSEKRRIGFY